MMNDPAPANEWLMADDKVRIRLLRPGDGFVCAKAAKQRVMPCTAPIVLAQIHGKRSDVRRKDDIEFWSTQVLCSRHLFDLLVPELRSSQEPKYKAMQALIDAHRDEFESLCVHFRDALAAQFTENIPPQLLALIQVPQEARDAE